MENTAARPRGRILAAAPRDSSAPCPPSTPPGCGTRAWIVYGNGITKLPPSFVVNNEGLLVRVQFSQDASGSWAASDLAWAPSVMVRGPYRWCSVAADAPPGRCAGPAADAATH
jgi:hypothetical protein